MPIPGSAASPCFHIASLQVTPRSSYTATGSHHLWQNSYASDTKASSFFAKSKELLKTPDFGTYLKNIKRRNRDRRSYTSDNDDEPVENNEEKLDDELEAIFELPQ